MFQLASFAFGQGWPSGEGVGQGFKRLGIRAPWYLIVSFYKHLLPKVLVDMQDAVASARYDWKKLTET